MQTIEQYQDRIKKLEDAIRLMNKRCDEYEGTSLLQFCAPLEEKEDFYQLIKAVIKK